jgi:hypothetical protein
MASLIANRWAGVTLRSVNLAYSGEQPLTSIQQQVAVARTEYETSQKAVEKFIQNNNIDVLTNRISESETLLTSISNDRSLQVIFFSERIQSLKNFVSTANGLKQQLLNSPDSTAASLGDALAIMFARADTLG